MAQMLTPSAAAIALLKEFEQGPNGGHASNAYSDPAGYMTIGWGHRILGPERFRPPLTEAKADELLRQDLDRIAPNIAKFLTARPEVTQSMFDAIVCLAFNIGLGAALGSTLMYKTKSADWQGAANEFLRWDKARNPKTGEKEPVAGLTRRRKAERELFLRDGIPD